MHFVASGWLRCLRLRPLLSRTTQPASEMQVLQRTAMHSAAPQTLPLQCLELGGEGLRRYCLLRLMLELLECHKLSTRGESGGLRRISAWRLAQAHVSRGHDESSRMPASAPYAAYRCRPQTVTSQARAGHLHEGFPSRNRLSDFHAPAVNHRVTRKLVSIQPSPKPRSTVPSFVGIC